MTVVLDASGALAVALGGESKEAVVAVLDAASAVIAPDLFIAEVTSGLWKYVVAGLISRSAAITSLETALELVTQYYAIAPLAEEALGAAVAHRHSVYDLYYVVLARRSGAAIVTFDRGMKRLCTAMGVPLAAG